MKRVVPLLLVLPLFFAAAPSRAQSAVDERAIIAAANALDAAIDAKDWEGARELLLDEISVALPGEEPTTLAADALVARWRDALHVAKTTFHLRGGERVIFDGADSAVLHSKAQVSTHVDGIAGDDLHELWSDYHHELDRTENGWRVRHYGYAPRLEHGNVAVIEHRLAADPETDATASGEPSAQDSNAVDGNGGPGAEADTLPNDGAAAIPGDDVGPGATAPADGG